MNEALYRFPFTLILLFFMMTKWHVISCLVISHYMSYLTSYFIMLYHNIVWIVLSHIISCWPYVANSHHTHNITLLHTTEHNTPHHTLTEYNITHHTTTQHNTSNQITSHHNTTEHNVLHYSGRASHIVSMKIPLGLKGGTAQELPLILLIQSKLPTSKEKTKASRLKSQSVSIISVIYDTLWYLWNCCTLLLQDQNLTHAIKPKLPP